MACQICRKQKKKFTIIVKDFEYNINYSAQYTQCKFCNSLSRSKPEKVNKNLFKLLYSKKSYLPLKGNFIYDLLKSLYATHEKKNILNKLSKSFLNKKKTILDVACGKGYLIKKFAKKKTYTCYGIDLNIETKNISNVKFIKSSYQNTYLIRKIKPDLIIMNNFIEHIEDLNIIRKIIVKMKKGSSLAILTPDGDSNGKSFFFNYWSGFHSPRHKTIFNPKSIKFFLEKNKKINISNFKLYDPFSNLISLSNLIKYGCFKFKILEIFKAITFIPFIFIDIFNKNRILTFVKKV